MGLFPEDAPLRHPKFLATLPFDENEVPRYRTERVLEIVRNRWVWFSNAAQKHPGYGTLGYLPFEIRQMIWIFALWKPRRTSLDGS